MAGIASPTLQDRERVVGAVADHEDEGRLGIGRGKAAEGCQHAGKVDRAVSRHAREYSTRRGRRTHREGGPFGDGSVLPNNLPSTPLRLGFGGSAAGGGGGGGSPTAPVISAMASP